MQVARLTVGNEQPYGADTLTTLCKSQSPFMYACAFNACHCHCDNGLYLISVNVRLINLTPPDLSCITCFCTLEVKKWSQRKIFVVCISNYETQI
jgi:hypothetical protein